MKKFVMSGSNEKEVKRFATNCDPASWAPSTNTKEQFTLDFSSVPAGSYRLAVGLFRNATDAAPTYLLGNAGKTENKWYVLGNVDLE